jgi:hypothetical protein
MEPILQAHLMSLVPAEQSASLTAERQPVVSLWL